MRQYEHIPVPKGQDSRVESGAVWLPLELEDATLLQRLNRFAARVLWRGEEVMAHVPNSGRLRELLVPGARVRVRPGGGAKTVCRLIMVEYGDGWAVVDAHMTNDILECAARAEWLMPGPFDIRREVQYGQSRLDMGCRNRDGFHLVEAKCVTLIEDGIALFPDAPTSRGVRHLRELAAAAAAGFHAHVVFLVQQPGARAFAANRAMDAEFADALEQAMDSGVQVHAIQCFIREDGIGLQGLIPLVRMETNFSW